MPMKAATPTRVEPVFRMERSHLEFGSLEEESDDLSYWRKQTPSIRLAGIEFLRRQFYTYGESGLEFRRLLEITQSSWG